MSEPQFEPVKIPRPGPPDLGISFLKPQGWQTVQVPDEPPRFDEPGFFLPLAIVMAPFGAVLFTVAARPAFEDGSVRQWTQFLCAENKVDIESGTDATLCGFDGCLVDGSQPSDMGLLKMRIFFFEDGKRLFQLGMIAPAEIWPSVLPSLEFTQRSFRLEQKVGQTAPIAPPPAEPEPAPVVAAESQAEAAPLPPEGEPTVAASVALSGDAESLKESHPTNARLRDNGVGLVPRVVDINDREKFAVLAAAAISATFTLPLGWHVIDDGKRTLIFDAPGKMQINLSRRPLEGRTHEQCIDEIVQQYTADQPAVQHLKLEMGGMQCVAFRNFKVEGEILEQVFFFKASAVHPGTALVCRVTADSEHMSFATNTAEVVLRDLDETGRRVAPQSWKEELDVLEKLGKLEEAEALILKSIDHLGVYSQAAYLWEQEAGRRTQAGDAAGAKQAAERAEKWLYAYAGSATSGGEGAALSLERDQRLSVLKPLLGK